MQASRTAWRGIGALLAAFCLVLSLALAPAVLALKHGPAAMAAELDHRAYHAEQGHAHDIAGADHHDSGDHDHVSAALLAASGTAVQPPPERTLRPETRASDGTIRDGPRRPPRLTVI
jgi:hypothetical protein